MASALPFKQEPGTEVPNVKYEPTDESEGAGQLTLKTENVFNFRVIQIHDTGPLEYVNVINRNTSVQGYDDQHNQPKFTRPAPKRKQIFQPTIIKDDFECNFCRTLFFNADSLEEHLVETHFVGKDFICTECTESFITQERLDSHMAEHLNEKEKQFPHKCPNCSKSFPTKFYLLRHSVSHNPIKSYKCQLCPKSYGRKQDLKIHVKVKHSQDKKFRCYNCPKTFAYNFQLQIHIRTHHKTGVIFCKNCSKNFKTKENLSHHRTVCKGTSSPAKKQDILTCDICSTVFFSVESLEEHVVEMHVVDKEFKCDECTKSFIAQDELDSHMAEHEDEEEAPDCHECPICSRTFKRPSYIQRHMRSHDGVKPLKCKFCPHTCSENWDLRRHERIRHSKEMKFKCSKCSKTYRHNFQLQEHILSHSNVKTIVCENCGVRFKTKPSLRYHRQFCDGTSSKNKLLAKKVHPKLCIAAEQKTLNYQYKNLINVPNFITGSKKTIKCSSL